MSDDDRVLANILRRLLNDPQADVNFGHEWERPFLTIEGGVDLTEAELDAIAAAERPNEREVQP